MTVTPGGSKKEATSADKAADEASKASEDGGEGFERIFGGGAWGGAGKAGGDDKKGAKAKKSDKKGKNGGSPSPMQRVRERRMDLNLLF